MVIQIFGGDFLLSSEAFDVHEGVGPSHPAFNCGKNPVTFIGARQITGVKKKTKKKTGSQLKRQRGRAK